MYFSELLSHLVFSDKNTAYPVLGQALAMTTLKADRGMVKRQWISLQRLEGCYRYLLWKLSDTCWLVFLLPLSWCHLWWGGIIPLNIDQHDLCQLTLSMKVLIFCNYFNKEKGGMVKKEGRAPLTRPTSVFLHTAVHFWQSLWYCQKYIAFK